jgi:hypothetical protein
MKVLIFGATGMVGQGVLRECLRAPDVKAVLSVGRTATGWLSGVQNPRLREIVHADMSSYGDIESELAGYERITYDFTLAAAQTLCRLNPQMTFIYISGSGTDSSEKGCMMWARVKGRTENALLRLPFKAYIFRPGFIEPMDGIQSKTPSYRIFYRVTKPLLPLLRRAFPNWILSTREIGQAMLSVARDDYKKWILETRDIRAAIPA